MIALGFGIIWAGYAAAFYGYSLVKGYNLSFREVVFPVGFYTGQWPPGLVNDATVLIPTGSNTGGGSTAGQTAPGTPPGFKPGPGNKCQPGFTYDPLTKTCIPTPFRR